VYDFGKQQANGEDYPYHKGNTLLREPIDKAPEEGGEGF